MPHPIAPDEADDNRGDDGDDGGWRHRRRGAKTIEQALWRVKGSGENRLRDAIRRACDVVGRK